MACYWHTRAVFFLHFYKRVIEGKTIPALQKGSNLGLIFIKITFLLPIYLLQVQMLGSFTVLEDQQSIR